MVHFLLANCITVVWGLCPSAKYLQKYGNYPHLFIKIGIVKNNGNDLEPLAHAGIRVDKALLVISLEWSYSCSSACCSNAFTRESTG